MARNSRNQGRPRRKKTSLVGSTSYGFAQGYRSEYLAHYVFSSLGTSVPVPGPQDTGIDLYCTLADRVGQRIWPKAYFSVQVKSTADPWCFESPESVRWLVDNPLPLFLCIVEKKALRFRMYHTFPRFYVQALPPLPQRLELIPGEGKEGKCTEYKDGVKFDLSAPILEFTLQEMLTEGFEETAKSVLQFWIDIDLENLQRKRNGVLNFRMPANYISGRTDGIRGWVTQGLNHASSEQLEEAIRWLKQPLDWIGDQLYKNGDLPLATRAMLLLQQLYWRDYERPQALNHDLQEIRRLVGSDGIDQLGRDLDVILLNTIDNPSHVKGLTRLHLKGASLTPAGLANLGNAKALERLVLSFTVIGDDELANIRNLSELKQLFLQGTSITDNGLAHLSGLKKIVILNLSNTAVGDAGLAHLGSLTRLENLYLNDTKVTDKGLPYLAGLENLEVVTLCRTKLTDHGLQFVLNASLPKLRKVEFSGSQVTEKGRTAYDEACTRWYEAGRR